MRNLTVALAGAALLGLTAYGQDAQRVYLLTKTTAPGGAQEIATVLRTVADVKTVTVDSSSLAITLTAPSAVAAMTDWLVPVLDRYPLDSPGGDRPVHSGPVAQIRKIFGVYAPRLVVFRGTSGQVAQADWLTRQLDIAPGAHPAGKPAYNPPWQISWPIKT